MLRSSFVRRVATQDVVVPALRSSSSIPSHQVQGARFSQDAVRGPRFASSTTEPSHNSLSSFLVYAKRTSLDRASTTFAGTHYEYVTQERLRKYGFDLTRVGGRGDRGVDLKGKWTIATEGSKIEADLPVVVQCKRLKSKVGPNLIRELEGALAGRLSTLGILVGTRGATKGVRDAMGRSRMAICWIMLDVEETMEDNRDDAEGSELASRNQSAMEDGKEQAHGFDGLLQTMKDEIVSQAPKKVQDLLQLSTEETSASPADEASRDTTLQLGRVQQMLWNAAASAMGLGGLDVVTRYEGTGNEDREVGKEVLLMWQGKEVLAQDKVALT